MRCCVYVGMTSKSAEDRLAEHLEGRAGYKSTDVTKCGGELRPDLAPRRTWRLQADVEIAEQALALSLDRKNYTVFPRSLLKAARRAAA